MAGHLLGDSLGLLARCASRWFSCLPRAFHSAGGRKSNLDMTQATGGADTVLTGTSRASVDLHNGNADPRDPYVSPVYGDLSGFPPRILTTGTRDRLLSDTVRMHRALLAVGVDAELHVWGAPGHGMFLGAAPEDAEKAQQIRRFLVRHWNG